MYKVLSTDYGDILRRYASKYADELIERIISHELIKNFLRAQFNFV